MTCHGTFWAMTIQSSNLPPVAQKTLSGAENSDRSRTDPERMRPETSSHHSHHGAHPLSQELVAEVSRDLWGVGPVCSWDPKILRPQRWTKVGRSGESLDVSQGLARKVWGCWSWTLEAPWRCWKSAGESGNQPEDGSNHQLIMTSWLHQLSPSINQSSN